MRFRSAAAVYAAGAPAAFALVSVYGDDLPVRTRIALTALWPAGMLVGTGLVSLGLLSWVSAETRGERPPWR